MLDSIRAKAMTNISTLHLFLTKKSDMVKMMKTGSGTQEDAHSTELTGRNYPLYRQTSNVREDLHLLRGRILLGR